MNWFLPELGHSCFLLQHLQLSLTGLHCQTSLQSQPAITTLIMTSLKSQPTIVKILNLYIMQQQYHVVPMPTGSAGPGFGSGTTGKLGRAWVVHGIGAWHQCMGWCTVLVGWEGAWSILCWVWVNL